MEQRMAEMQFVDRSARGRGADQAGGQSPRRRALMVLCRRTSPSTSRACGLRDLP